MALNISNYQCEWATTLDNPERLKRFSHFINSSETDSAIAFVEERQQIRPATETEKVQLIAKAS